MTGGFRNILVSKLRRLGDVLLTVPVVTGLKRALPEARVSLLVNPGAEDLVRFHPDVSAVLTVPRGTGPFRQLGFLRRLRQGKFDLVLELSEGDRGAFLAWVSGAGTRVGYRPRPDKKWGRRNFYTHVVDADVKALHTVEYHLAMVRALGLDPGVQPLSLYWPPVADEKVRGLLAAEGLADQGSFALLHPASYNLFKTWRPDGAARVIDHLACNHGLPVVLTGSGDLVERILIRDITARTRVPFLDLSGRLTLAELAALIARARLFIGVDSLPMHMAAAVGTPVLALFGPSRDRVWGPWGRGHRVYFKDWDCRPCDRAGCDDKGVSRCLAEMTPGEVLAVVDEILGRP
ncbi:MAG: putative lipopolysaccharide heptosyltransferase III [Pseudomonadota bacterium]